MKDLVDDLVEDKNKKINLENITILTPNIKKNNEEECNDTFKEMEYENKQIQYVDDIYYMYHDFKKYINDGGLPLCENLNINDFEKFLIFLIEKDR